MRLNADSCSPTAATMNTKVLTTIFFLIIGNCHVLLANDELNNSIPGSSKKITQSTRRHLTTKYGQILAEVLSGTKVSHERKLDKLAECLIGSYEKRLVQAIFATAIDEMINFQTPETLATLLREVYQPGKFKTFEVMVKAQLYLYWKFNDRRDLNDLYNFNMGYYFSQIKNDPFYELLPNGLQRRLQNASKNLPTSVQNLFFETKFCLLNKHYSEYIYTTNPVEFDNQRRHVFTWTEPNFVRGNGAWQMNVTEVMANSNSNEPELNLKLALKSYELNMFMYLEQSVETIMNLVVAWRSGEAPSQSAWSVQLVENSLIFSQNGLKMCTSTRLFSDQRRYVYGYNDNVHTTMTPTCQWIAQPCPIVD